MENKNGKSCSNRPETLTKIANLPSLSVLVQRFRADAHYEYLRFGQWFFNNYCKDMTPDPFHMDFDDAVEVIHQWLIDNQYTYTTPRTLKEKDSCQTKTTSNA